jgi:pimeloyl-ACP methyl ester carboxylesterase
MTDVILVHGAWHGGWAWDRVVPFLEAAGHRAVAVDLPATGPDGHGATLADHADVLRRAVEEAPAAPAVVAHSYGGLVAQAALAATNAPVGKLVLLDAWLGDDGDSLMSLAPDWAAGYWKSTRTSGEAGDTIPPPPPELVGVTDPDDAAMLQARLTDQPWATFNDPLSLPGDWLRSPSVAVVCHPPSGIPFEEWARVRGLPVVRLESGHDAMITVPGPLAEILVRLLDPS